MNRKTKREKERQTRYRKRDKQNTERDKQDTEWETDAERRGTYTHKIQTYIVICTNESKVLKEETNT